ncbi:MAG: hypothetical protein A2X67_12250 [Ignavibacteria bacterium GWA2_55_11]|nr:MAG: hypothetical protein A2X67_12250 [Ignavibacteria bacterium GWA2_55_11]OGU44204.1 MAG: hypothetical protein A2X68_13010 [Ignavibacteria bacterium GWC2_56_12]OGU74843.1 MAG: hypothetical protein A3H45_13855 [Ignavibacteria bacterium RIFCSPLOWO2_02_FULL_55_14]OGU75869.1 MAG: hypothetical protein A3G43_09435 [Ignavibacteria bacterium RIFCSPLOWO2_12_FULL_56_21]
MASRTSDVLILGAGVTGASLAFRLAERGMSVTVIDAGEDVGAGSTPRATGGYRAQFSSEINIRLSLFSRHMLLRFAEETGVDPEYRQCGYLFLAETEEQLAGLTAAVELQKKCGVEGVQIVRMEEIAAINPHIALNGVVGGSFGSTDGFIRPLKILEGFIMASRRQGVRFIWGEKVTGFRTNGEWVKEVITGKHEYAAGSVVNCAGAWAGKVSGLAGADVPIRPLKRQVAATMPTDIIPPDLPLSIFLGNGFHFRERDGRVLLLLTVDPEAKDAFDTRVEHSWVQRVRTEADRWVPKLRDTQIDREACWAGLYEMTPDHHAIAGRVPGFENFYILGGSSGHGVMHSPALGLLMAELISEGKFRTLDVSALDPGRFAAGKEIGGVHLI